MAALQGCWLPEEVSCLARFVTARVRKTPTTNKGRKR